MKTSYEIYDSPRTGTRAKQFLAALFMAGVSQNRPVTYTKTYKGDKDILVVYGPGGPDRLPFIKHHLNVGKRVVMFDLGYWGRYDKNLKFRVSIDRYHPNHVINNMDLPKGRLDFQLPFYEGYNPDGKILVIGTGKKTRSLIGDWDEQTISTLSGLFPDRPLVYRPKPTKIVHKIIGVENQNTEIPITEALIDTSLVVCKHSNVAVDSLLAQVPCVCEDGIAHALIGSNTLQKQFVPSKEQVQDFYEKTAWFQWSADEAHDCWHFLDKLVQT